MRGATWVLLISAALAAGCGAGEPGGSGDALVLHQREADGAALIEGPATTVGAPPPSEPSTPAPDRTATASAPPAEEPVPPPAAEPAPEDARLRLVGRTFTGTAVTEGGRARPLVEGTDITVAFEHDPNGGEDVARWNAGCNTAGAPVAISADRLDIGPDGGSTGAGCARADHDQDDWLGRFFHADPSWALHDGTLTLTVGDTVITLVEEPRT